MLNIHELETKWLHYKIKSYIPYATIGISLIVIIFAISLVDLDTKKDIQINTTIKDTKIEEVIHVTTKKEPLPQKVVIKEIQIVKQEKNNDNSKTVISPSLDFMNTMSSSSPTYYNTNVVKRENTPPKRKISKKKEEYVKPVVKIKKQQQEEIKVEAPKIEVVKNSTIKIKRRNTREDIQHVIGRFKKSNNPALSLFIAKKYYELKNYNQAYSYALITNELNSDIEESWIIFAKSLVKLNKKDKAIKTLNRYIKHSHSHKAKLLLDNIRLGKLK